MLVYILILALTVLQGGKEGEQVEYPAEARFPRSALISNPGALPYISKKEPAPGEFFVNSSPNIDLLGCLSIDNMFLYMFSMT